jgi:hypothetical protein
MPQVLAARGDVYEKRRRFSRRNTAHINNRARRGPRDPCSLHQLQMPAMHSRFDVLVLGHRGLLVSGQKLCCESPDGQLCIRGRGRRVEFGVVQRDLVDVRDGS